ncbi:MAG: fumarylacetoacetate hydrolase family protein, partial [Bowdeniella nasicola]|nr:fumarylacetoacetate hydrolase family protein [Bowdeniella nasicola]
CKDVPITRANDVIFGYTAANDVSARTAQRGDSTWARGKGFDTSTPLGPFLITVDDEEFTPEDAAISCRVNGQVRQDANTSAMVFSIAELISYVSHVCSLLPGDVILTGTPAGVGPLHDGDQVSVEIAGIGTLTNPVFRRD